MAPSSNSPAAIVLAAGQGTRMRSQLPKVLHLLAGDPLLRHVLAAAQGAGFDPLVVVVSPSNRDQIEAAVASFGLQADVHFAIQAKPRGTGDAAQAGLTALDEAAAKSEAVAILCGDAPLLRAATLQALAQARGERALSVLGANLTDPSGYGRLVRDATGAVRQIVEHKDASQAQRAIGEVNSGAYIVDRAYLGGALAALTPANAQNELYLTDIVAQADSGAGALILADPTEAMGVNSRVDLAQAEHVLHQRLVLAHQLAGVSFVQPTSVVLGTRARCGQDVTLGPGVQLLGDTQIASGVSIEGPSVLIDSEVHAGAVVHAFCHLERASVGEGVSIGPYARLRPGATIMAKARVGNFVEIKNSTLRPGAKANHLAYVGDTQVGENSNIGAGTITANYDGYNKHKTAIGKNCLVGSNATLVAPVTIGDGAIVAAGSVITHSVEADGLAFGRAQQKELPKRARSLREKLARQRASSSTLK